MSIIHIHLNSCDPDNISEVKEEDSAPALPDRCAGIEFDAITPDEKGNTLFFQGSLYVCFFLPALRIWDKLPILHGMPTGAYMWKDFLGAAQPVSESFKEIDDIPNTGRINAAFRMHNKANPDDHDRIYLFLVLQTS